jgi:hypothetical protein
MFRGIHFFLPLGPFACHIPQKHIRHPHYCRTHIVFKGRQCALAHRTGNGIARHRKRHRQTVTQTLGIFFDDGFINRDMVFFMVINFAV